MALTKVIGAGLGTVTEDQVFGGATPTVTIGDAGAEDAKIVFDGNAQDYHIGLDDSADTLVIGKGSALGTTTSMSFDANGIITKPLQPAFHVTISSSQTNFAVATTHTIVFGTEIYDQNADFASNTFTAPVTGKYLLVANMGLLNIDIDASYLYIQIVTSNRNYLNIKDFRALDFDATYWSQSVTGIADMDANDTAIVQLRITGGAAQTDLEGNEAYTYFSGYLLG
jgi:hypothetical protein